MPEVCVQSTSLQKGPEFASVRSAGELSAFQDLQVGQVLLEAAWKLDVAMNSQAACVFPPTRLCMYFTSWFILPRVLCSNCSDFLVFQLVLFAVSDT